VLALVSSPYDTSPGQRYRIEQWEPHLAARGIDIEFAPFEDAELSAVLYRPGHAAQKAALMGRRFAARARLLRGAHDFDAAYVFREASPIGPAVFERSLRRRRLPYVYDFDDAVFVPYRSPSNGYLSLLKYPPKTRTACRLAAHVMAGNAYLADYARRFNADVSVVPTTIDLSTYQVPPDPHSDPPVIGWTGSHSTVQHLDTLRPALQRLARTHRFRLRVIGADAVVLVGGDVEVTPWRADTEVEDLTGIDIGVMPLPDDAWTRGKCGAKALQYMGLAIPTVCSPVGVNVDIIDHRRNGLLAGTEEEWVAGLGELLDSPQLRRQLGAAGRTTVEEDFDGAKVAQQVADIFETVVTARHPDGDRPGRSGAR
jgi:glycosyltransferase involved in cell wall biosynthesis